MKGISTIIATILMLMITLALAGTAYLFISGAFTSQMQGIELIDAYCSSSTVTISVRNVGTNSISSITCTQTAPSGDTTGTPCISAGGTVSDFDPVTAGNQVLAPGAIGSFTDTCSGTGARSCIYRLVPPSGRSVQPTASCI